MSTSSSSKSKYLFSSSSSSNSEFIESAKTEFVLQTSKTDNKKNSTREVPQPLTLDSPTVSWNPVTTFSTFSANFTDLHTDDSTLTTPSSIPITLSSSSAPTHPKNSVKTSLTQETSRSSQIEPLTDSTLSPSDYRVTTTESSASSPTKTTTKYPLITYTRTQTQVWLVTQSDRIATHTSVTVIKHTLTPTFDARSATESIFGSLAAATSTVVAADAQLAGNSDTGTSTGVIVGSVVGSIAGVALISLILMFFLTNIKKKKKCGTYGGDATTGNMENRGGSKDTDGFENSGRGARQVNESNPFTNPSMLSISDHHAAVLTTTEIPFENSSRNRAGFSGKWWPANAKRSPFPEAAAIPITADESTFKRSGRGKDPGKPNTGASRWNKIPLYNALFSKKSKINHSNQGNSTDKSGVKGEDGSLPAISENLVSFYRPPRRPSSCTVRKESHSREHSLKKHESIHPYVGVSNTSPTGRMAIFNPYEYMELNGQERSLFAEAGNTTESSQLHSGSPTSLTPKLARYDSYAAPPGAAVVIGVTSPFLDDDIRSPSWSNTSPPANYQENNSIAYGMTPYDSSVYSSEEEECSPTHPHRAKR